MIATGSLLLSLLIASASVSAQAPATPSVIASASVSAQAPATPSASNSSNGAGPGAVSTSCAAAASSVISGDLSKCANLAAFSAISGAAGSIVTPVNDWINSICSSDPCSSAVLSAASSQVSKGCASDIAKGNSIANVLNVVVSQYTPVRDMLCLETASNSTSCLTNLLTDVQKFNGVDITFSDIGALLAGSQAALADVAKVPQSVFCTDCFKGLSVKLGSIVSNLTSVNVATNVSSSISSSVAALCGASFGDGKIPATLKEGASGASASGSASAIGAAVSTDSNKSSTSGAALKGGLLTAIAATSAGFIAGFVAVAL